MHCSKPEGPRGVCVPRHGDYTASKRDRSVPSRHLHSSKQVCLDHRLLRAIRTEHHPVLSRYALPLLPQALRRDRWFPCHLVQEKAPDAVLRGVLCVRFLMGRTFVRTSPHSPSSRSFYSHWWSAVSPSPNFVKYATPSLTTRVQLHADRSLFPTGGKPAVFSCLSVRREPQKVITGTRGAANV